MKKIIRISAAVLGSLILIFTIFTLVVAFRLAAISKRIDDNTAPLIQDQHYLTPASVPNVPILRQQVSCGYAVLEMYAGWRNDGTVTEQSLLQDNAGKIVTAAGNGFEREMNRRFTDLKITKRRNLKNTEFLAACFDTLLRGYPVPVELAAIDKAPGGSGRWSLHFALVTAMDFAGDVVTVANPYGYEETYTVQEFLSSTRYDSYARMSFPLCFAFGLGIFNKNTLYTVEARPA